MSRESGQRPREEGCCWGTQENLHTAQPSPGERQCSSMFAGDSVWATVEITGKYQRSVKVMWS